MLKVRLQRVGRKNDPSFRLVVVESTKAPKTGNYIEMLGSYNPRQKGNTVIHADRVKHWIAEGAQPSDTVHNLLINEKVIEGKKVNPLGKKTPIVKAKEDAEESEAPKAEADGGDDASDAPEEKPEEAPAEEDDAPKDADSAAADEVAKAEPEDNSAAESAEADSEENKNEDEKKEA